MSLDGAGPFSMLAISALESHIKSVSFAGKEYAAIQWDGGTTLTQAMIFCRGLLGYNDQQQVVLRNMMGGGVVVEPGDWIVMVSRSEYGVLRLNESASLFALMPNVALSTPEDRLSRIARAHVKSSYEGGTTDGLCVECGQFYPCPTYTWATSDRDPLSTWDPADDSESEVDESNG